MNILHCMRKGAKYEDDRAKKKTDQEMTRKTSERERERCK